MTKNIRKVVFTGGPGGGKSAIISPAKKHLESLGWGVIVISEMATMFDESGVGPSKVISSAETGFDFQKEVLATQLLREKSVVNLAQNLPAENIAILCDRAICDQIAYIGESEFIRLLREVGDVGSISDAKMRYGAVIHMVTAAHGAEKFYVNKDKDPSSPRHESIEQARQLDEITKNAWLGHAHHAIIDNSTGFDQKIDRALKALSGMLGIPEPFEIERKYLIEQPPLATLLEAGARQFLIRQVYLETDNSNDEERIRMEAGEGGVTYTHTTKIGSGLKRTEIEYVIGFDTYRALELRHDPDLSPIVKTRYRLLSDNHVIEIDIYPNCDFAILEVELREESETVELPDFVEVLQDVTGNEEFTNWQFAAGGFYNLGWDAENGYDGRLADELNYIDESDDDCDCES